MDRPLRIGLIGADTTHAVSFTRLLNNQSHPDHVPGAEVVAVFPGGSPDMEISISRVEGITRTLQEEFHVKVFNSPAEVAAVVDLVFIESVDGRVHLRQFHETCKYRRPTFVDKPFATSVHDATALLDLARQHNVRVFASSSLRYAPELVRFHNDHRMSSEKIVRCDVKGPLPIEPTQTHFFWYGIHSAEILLAIMGTGCREVEVESTDDEDFVTGYWEDGRIGTIGGSRDPTSPFSVSVHCEHGEANILLGGRAKTVEILRAILDVLSEGNAGRLWRASDRGLISVSRSGHLLDPSLSETLEIIKLLEAANKSRDSKARVAL